MTFYIRHKETGNDLVLKSINIPNRRLTVEIDGEEDQITLPEAIENYDFRYDIW